MSRTTGGLSSGDDTVTFRRLIGQILDANQVLTAPMYLDLALGLAGHTAGCAAVTGQAP